MVGRDELDPGRDVFPESGDVSVGWIREASDPGPADERNPKGPDDDGRGAPKRMSPDASIGLGAINGGC